MLRAGLNNGAPSFGAGLLYGSFQLDYSYGWLADRDLDPNHRVSVTFSFGPTKQEMVRRAELRRAQEIEEEMRARREWERRQTILGGLREGQAALERGDYYVAFREFTRVLSIPDSVGLDPDLIEARQEAREKLRLTDQRLQEQFAQEAARQAQERESQRRQAFLEEHFKKAQAFLAQNNYVAAVREFDRILEEMPGHAQTVEFREKAVQEQRAAAQALIQDAEREARKPGGANEAIRIYREAAKVAEGQPDLASLVEGRIARLTQQLNFDNLFRQGLEERRNGNYAAAAEAFKRAMQLQPQNAVVRQHYEEALQRAMAKDVEPEGQARELYREGFRLYQQNRFEEALQKFEEANRLQPYVRRILQGIDAAKEQIAKSQGRQRPE
jgi:tetratricopeptide (TPR) repeat protein